MQVLNENRYSLRNYLESIRKASKLSCSLGVWSLCAISSVLMMKVNAAVNFRFYFRAN